MTIKARGECQDLAQIVKDSAKVWDGLLEREQKGTFVTSERNNEGL